ncbi:MAG: nitric-oxide reductase large subunit [Halolamina sp.]
MRVRRRTLARLLAVVFVVNLVVMGIGAWYSAEQAPPIPETVEGPDGETLVTADSVREGKRVFQRNGLMNHGSVLGNGAYFGNDLTADALDAKTRFMRQFYARERYDQSYDSLDGAQQAAVNQLVRSDLREPYDGGAVEYSEAEAAAHERVRKLYVDRYHEGSERLGIPEGTVPTEAAARQLADFALWTAWFSHTPRPGTDHSYTNNWPPAPASGNTAPASALLWSVVSMILLVGGAGIAVWLYSSISLPEPDTEISVPHPSEMDVLPTQRAVARYVPVAAGLFFAQTLLGALLAHYYVERDGFFGLFEAVGVDIVSVAPFLLARTYHIDLAVLWVATLWIAAGLFLPPLLTGEDPPWQAHGATAILAALVTVVVGGFAGVFLATNGSFDPTGELWWLLGTEGLEYLEVGRIWKLGLLAGFAGWTVLVFRGIRPLLRRESRYGLGHLILVSGGSIGLLFVAGLLYTPDTNMVVTEFWRWWVVHMWVEGAFEFFIVAVVGLTLVGMNLLEPESAAKAVLLEALLVMGAGIIGVSHHYWWIGLPDLWVPIGTVFSTLELIPLVVVLFEAMNEYRALVDRGETFPYRLTFAFIVASGVWNFVGAGVLGFFINLPLVNYYEHGTYLTVAHAHAAMFGAFGLLALGIGVYVLRITVEDWAERRLWWAFGLWNTGLAVMVVASLLPIGFLQLETAYVAGYDAARSLAFYNRPLVQAFFWLRFPGDTMLIAGAALFCYDVAMKLRRLRTATPPEEAGAGTLQVEGDAGTDWEGNG